MSRRIELQIRSIQEMADRMIVVSEQGFASCDDDGCLLLNGMVRECAYRIRDAAERERQAHGLQGSRNGRSVERTAAEKMYDLSVTDSVRTVLSAHRSTSSMQPQVETTNGEVTLTGFAGSTAFKALVTKLVADINGVTRVKNRMTVKAAGAGEAGGSPPDAAGPNRAPQQRGS